MSSLIVKYIQSDDRVFISLELVTSENSEIKRSVFNMNRLKSETCEIAIHRLELNLQKKISKTKKCRKKKISKAVNSKNDSGSNSSLSQPELDKNSEHVPAHPKLDTEDMKSNTNCISISLLHDNIPIELSSTTNGNAWIDGAVLRINDEDIPVTFNPPSVTLNNLPAVIMEGFPLYPYPKYEFVDQEKCEFLWKSVPSNDVSSVSKSITDSNLDLASTVSCQSYTPSAEDIGNHILLACVPRGGEREGRITAVISKSAVTKGPGQCPFEKRHRCTAKRTDHGLFRVMSYNLLAEMYTESEIARTRKFFYCPQHALDMEYRKHLLLKEILGYQADILCMQEVDHSIFHSHLTPALSLHGYSGLFRPKLQAGEGCATFFRDSKFREVKQLDITLTEYLASDPCCADIWQAVSQCQSLKRILLERSSILQVTVLESVESPGKLLCVANSHLYFRPNAGNVRLIQAAVAIRYIQNVCAAFKQEGYDDVAMVFCGDFNSCPKSGVCSFYFSKIVEADSQHWNSAGPEQCVHLSLSQPMNIISACGTPRYSNYTPYYTELLDWIFIDSDILSVDRVIPMPDHEDVSAHSGIPNILFPSDHLALICDLKFQ